jgi:FkbM family methyltransferase
MPSEKLQNAVAAHQMGRLGEAEALYRQLLETDPTNFEALGLLESLYSAQGRLAEIIPLYRKTLTLAHQFFMARSMHGGLQRLKTLGFNPESILDIGAYEGGWTRVAKAVFPQSRVLMIEAQTEKATVLDTVCKGFDGSVEYRIALLGRRNQEEAPYYQMITPWGSTGSSLYEEQTAFERRVITLPMRRLDDLLVANTRQRFPFIKLDVQGAEIEVLAGGLETLKATELVLLEASFLEYNKGAPQFAEVVAFMNANGFVVFDILDCFRAKQAVLFQSDIIFVRKDSPLRPTGLVESATG